MVHKLRDAAAAVERELNTTTHALSAFGSFEVRPIPVMKYRGWRFQVKFERAPPINPRTIGLIRRLFTKHLHAQGIELAKEAEFLSELSRHKYLGNDSVIDYRPKESKQRPYNWSWVLNLLKEKPEED